MHPTKIATTDGCCNFLKSHEIPSQESVLDNVGGHTSDCDVMLPDIANTQRSL
jgi:hypothetical protein